MSGTYTLTMVKFIKLNVDDSVHAALVAQKGSLTWEQFLIGDKVSR